MKYMPTMLRKAKHTIFQRFARIVHAALTPEESPLYKRAYSQQGEDLVIDCLFQWNTKGFYVDVGAHHPLRFSNTQLFYAKGWRGINIDPNPGLMSQFAKLRPEDTNLELAIAARPGKLTFYIFPDPALNTCHRSTAERYEAEGRSQRVQEVLVDALPLADVLNVHLPAGTTIDFLSVDAEGLDEEVLRSNDWGRHRPRAVIIEDAHAFTIEEVMRSDATQYLDTIGYVPVSKLVNSIIYCDAVRIRNAHDQLIA